MKHDEHDRHRLSIVRIEPPTTLVCSLGCCGEPAGYQFVGRRSDGGDLFTCSRHVSQVQEWVGGHPITIHPAP